MEDDRTITVGGREYIVNSRGVFPLDGRNMVKSAESAGYHVRQIPRGTYGEASKILEEALEFGDATEQGCKVMALVELADLIGAAQGYLDNHFPGTTIDDLCMMAALTKRAMRNGQWSERR